MRNKVRFLKTLLGVDDGRIYPVQFEAGEVCEIGSDLTATLLADGAIELVIEEKAVEAAPENKAHTKAPENKRKGKK